MDYTQWPQTSLPSNSNPLPVDPYYSHQPYYPSHPPPHPHPQSLNPNPNANLQIHEYYPAVTSESTLKPPGVDSYAFPASYPDGHGVYEVHAAAPFDRHQLVDTAGYWDPNTHDWALKEAVRQYGVDPAGYAGAGMTISPNGMELSATVNPNSILWADHPVQPHGNGTLKKRPKKTKVIQSAYCEVCKIECNSKDVLDQHKLGKKHKKNLEKLQEAAAAAGNISSGPNVPVIGPQENPNKAENGQKNRKKTVKPAEDLEIKRKKIVEGGAASESIRTCALCNVVCNSETVFNYHLAGHKHAAMVRKHAARTAGATAN